MNTMKRILLHSFSLFAIAALFSATTARADVAGINMDFEDYNLGELLGQDAWGFAAGWTNAWEIVEHAGPDGNTTKCLGSKVDLANNWPRAHYTIATQSLTRYPWPTTGRFRLSFDILMTRAVPVNIYFLGAQRANVFQLAYNSRADRIQTSPGGAMVNSVVANAQWHHIDVDMNFKTSTLDFFCDGLAKSSGQAFNTPAESLESFGQIILQFAANGADTVGANDGLYLDNIRIYRTDTDSREATLLVIK